MIPLRFAVDAAVALTLLGHLRKLSLGKGNVMKDCCWNTFSWNRKPKSEQNVGYPTVVIPIRP
jgi:hypothetical protein